MQNKMESIKNNDNFLTFDIALSKKRKEQMMENLKKTSCYCKYKNILGSGTIIKNFNDSYDFEEFWVILLNRGNFLIQKQACHQPMR